MVTTVISGCQTGADQAGLRAARTCGYQTGGMMPLGWRTEEGPRPDLAELYGLTQSRFEGYEHRTRQNIRGSDATIIFSLGSLDGGSYLTSASAQAQGKPLMVITEWYADVGFRPLPAAVRRFLIDRQISVVNIAGNRESKSPGIGGWVEAYLLEVLKPQ